MAEDETIFDASLKKKKKKKTGFNLDAIDVTLEQQENGGAIDMDEPVDEVELLGKKKKKKIVFNLDELKDSLSDGADEVPKSSINIDDIDMDFTKMKKKPKMKGKSAPIEEISNDRIRDDAVGENEMELLGKKKKKKATTANQDDMEPSMDSNGDVTKPMNIEDMDMDFSKMKKKPKMKLSRTGMEDLRSDDKGKDDIDGKENADSVSWIESDRDYTYEELYQRSFNILKEKNPDMATGEKKKFVMKPPRVMRIGSKKTAFANFSEICKLLHRIPKHLLQFLLAELGTSGSIDGNNQLIIKGRFQQKQIENVLKRYIKEYVTCHTCRSPNTILQKDARLYFLQCEQCNSRCSVAPIKSGFQAVANKQQRQAIRASKN